jgi:PhnB protein
MSAQTPVPPPVTNSIAPWLNVRGGKRAIDFYKSAFGAVEVYHIENPAGDPVSRLSVGGSEFWVSDESPDHKNFSPESIGGCSVRLILTVADPDTVYARAVAAGAKQISPVGEGHGWRIGRLVDPFGHHWEIGCLIRPEPPTALPKRESLDD